VRKALSVASSIHMAGLLNVFVNIFAPEFTCRTSNFLFPLHPSTSSTRKSKLPLLPRSQRRILLLLPLMPLWLFMYNRKIINNWCSKSMLLHELHHAHLD
jgi:hypothetical protein